LDKEYRTLSKDFWLKVILPTASVAISLAQGVQPVAAAPVNRGAVLQTLKACRRASDNCRTAIDHAWAELVFPNVHRAGLGLSGTGVNGALVEQGRIIGLYTMTGGPAIAPPGVDGASAVFAFERDGIVKRLTSGETWRVGSAADVKLITENTGDIPPAADVEAFVFNRSGLRGALSLDGYEVSRMGTPRLTPRI
jgi:lipid-binding SYLF domain-containing protein